MGIRWYTKGRIDLAKAEARRGCKDCSRSSVMCAECSTKAIKLISYAKTNVPPKKAMVVDGDNYHTSIKVKEYDFVSGKLYPEFSNTLDIKKAMHDCLGEGFSILLSGPNGTGKTVFGVDLALSYARHPGGYSAFYCTFPELHRFHTMSFKRDEYDELLEDLMDVDLLIVDELGKETSLTGSVEYLADSFLKMREERLLQNVLITNLPIKGLKGTQGKPGRYGPSFWASLQEFYRVFIYPPKGGNLRLERRRNWRGEVGA